MEQTPETPLWYRITWILGVIIFKLAFRISIEGQRKIPAEGGAVIASNHRSYLDPIVVALLTPRRINFMAKQELFRNPVFGYLIRKLGAFPLKRNSLDKTAYRRALKALTGGNILVLFPEGTRSLSGKLGKLREGPVKIAISSKVPVIPVVIMGTEKALPPGKKLIKPKKIRVKVGNSIFCDYTQKKQVPDILQNLQDQMIDMGANN